MSDSTCLHPTQVFCLMSDFVLYLLWYAKFVLLLFYQIYDNHLNTFELCDFSCLATGHHCLGNTLLGKAFSIIRNVKEMLGRVARSPSPSRYFPRQVFILFFLAHRYFPRHFFKQGKQPNHIEASQIIHKPNLTISKLT